MTPDETRTVPRGRHRKPRHRRALQAAGALTLTAGAATLIHLSTPDAPPRDTRAAALPSPEESGAPTAPSENAEAAGPSRAPTPRQTPRPDPRPTSPKAQGGKAREPLTQQPTPPRTPSESTRTMTPPPAPRTSHTSEPPPEHRPTPPPPATTPPPQPPPPGDEAKDEDDDRGLCLPLLNICLGG
ncbi:hypothetical protein GCM10010243_04160 [Streptomyces matensis]|nr:hypothetical protein GCM10010243_04160 [Streptomyces matensis]